MDVKFCFMFWLVFCFYKEIRLTHYILEVSNSSCCKLTMLSRMCKVELSAKTAKEREAKVQKSLCPQMQWWITFGYDVSVFFIVLMMLHYGNQLWTCGILSGTYLNKSCLDLKVINYHFPEKNSRIIYPILFVCLLVSFIIL